MHGQAPARAGESTRDAQFRGMEGDLPDHSSGSVRCSTTALSCSAGQRWQFPQDLVHSRALNLLEERPRSCTALGPPPSLGAAPNAAAQSQVQLLVVCPTRCRRWWACLHLMTRNCIVPVAPSTIAHCLSEDCNASCARASAPPSCRTSSLAAFQGSAVQGLVPRQAAAALCLALQGLALAALQAAHVQHKLLSRDQGMRSQAQVCCES